MGDQISANRIHSSQVVHFPLHFRFTVQSNDKDPEDPPEWKQLLDVNKEDPSQSEFVLMEPHSCHLMVDHFTGFALVGESSSEELAVRHVQLVGFATPPTRDGDCVVRVYCVAGTQDALQVCLLFLVLLLLLLLLLLLIMIITMIMIIIIISTAAAAAAVVVIIIGYYYFY